jgi:tRNA 2-thiouridine synthesizing protein C
MSAKYDLLIVTRATPYSSAAANEALDLALAAGTFEQSVGLLFSGDGVYQLKDNQSADALKQKHLNRMLKALPLYGIPVIFVDQVSLEERALDMKKDLNPELAMERLSTPQVSALYAQSKTVLHF